MFVVCINHWQNMLLTSWSSQTRTEEGHGEGTIPGTKYHIWLRTASVSLFPVSSQDQKVLWGLKDLAEAVSIAIDPSISILAQTNISARSTSSFILFSSCERIFPLPPAVHGSRCNRFSKGAPLLASLLRLQYRQTSWTNSIFFRILNLPM